MSTPRKRIGQAGIRGARVAGKYPAFSKGTPAECVVIAVYFIDDRLNRSKKFTEYDVKDLRTGQIYRNVRRLDSAQGMDDGEDNVLRPAQKLIGTQSQVFDPKVHQLSQSDGDRVMVSFSYGAHHTAVITDVLPHPQLSYGTTKSQGQRRFQTHKGTSVEVQQDGTYQIKRGDTTITLNADETIEVVHKTGSRMRFLDNGDIEVEAKAHLITDGDQILHGVNAVQPAIRGTDFNTNTLSPISTSATTLIASLAAASTILNAPPGPPTTLGPALAAVIAALTADANAVVAAIASYAAALSKKVVTE